MANEQFSVDVSRWVEKALGKATAVLHAIVSDGLAEVKELTPVRTGYLRANWTASFTWDVTPTRDASGEAAEVIAESQLGQTIIICNPVVYARRIEFGFIGTDALGRHYNEAGHGMMQQTIAEMPTIAERAEQRVAGS